MDEEREKYLEDIRGRCKIMAAAIETYNEAAKVTGIVDQKARELFFTQDFMQVIREAYKPNIIHYNPNWHETEDEIVGEEFFYIELCGVNYKVFSLYRREKA